VLGLPRTHTSEHTRPNPSQTGRYSIFLPGRDGRLSWLCVKCKRFQTFGFVYNQICCKFYIQHTSAMMLAGMTTITWRHWRSTVEESDLPVWRNSHILILWCWTCECSLRKLFVGVLGLRIRVVTWLSRSGRNKLDVYLKLLTFWVCDADHHSGERLRGRQKFAGSCLRY